MSMIRALARVAAGAAITLTLSTAASGQAHDHPTGPNAAPQGADAQRAVRTIEALFAAAERNDMVALDTLYAGDSLLVIEGAGINRGWKDYRDNHLGPELKEFKNFKYRPFEIEARVVGDVAWVTYRYAISAEMGERKIDSVGRGTAILERRGAKWVVRLTQTGSRARRPTDPAMP